MQNPQQISSKLLTANVKAGGCAAKISAAELHEALKAITVGSDPNLLTSLENFEDAAVYKITEDLAIIQTIDFFPPLLDDPYLYGQIAATNALSDVYAMGGKPVLALNILCFPTCDFEPQVIAEILRGGSSQVAAAGAIVAGGHSIQSPEPIYGLSVMGTVNPLFMLTNCGARDGDEIVLCKAIGTGVALLGVKAKNLSPQAEKKLFDSLTTLNDKSLAVAQRFTVHAATDVTGFGLIGHLHEMAKASGLIATLLADNVLFLPETLQLAEQGFVPAGAYSNRQSYEQIITYIDDVDLAVTDLLFDPQTAGGLLFSVAGGEAEKLCRSMADEGIEASCIGRFKKGNAGNVEVAKNGKNA
jgi:selenide, water dikinase